MSCQIKNGEYFAPNGNESILFKELKDKVGEAQAQDLFVLAYSNEFKRSEVQPIVNSYKNNILSKLNSITPKTKDLQYKIVKTGGFETIQAFSGKKKVGYIRLLPYKDGYKIERVLLSAGIEKGQGIGTELYKNAIKYTLRNGNTFYSDNSQTQEAKNVWEKLGKLGIVNEENGTYRVSSFPQKYFDKNGEPKAERVIEFARLQNENKEPLTFIEMEDVRMMMTQFPQVENSEELYTELEKAFYKDGLFNPTTKSLTNKMYTKYEAERILSNLSLMAEVKQNIERLKRTEAIENTLTLDTQIRTNDIDGFGKYKLLNPYKVKQDLIEELGGIQDVDLADIKDKSITQDVLNEFKRIPVINEQGEEVLNKVVYENASTLPNVEKIYKATSEQAVKDILLESGIKAEEIEPSILKNFIENPSIQNTAEMNKNAPQREKVIKIAEQERDLVYLETLKTEQELFDEMSLLKTEVDNVYHRIEKVDLDELKTALELEDVTTELEAYKEYFNYSEIKDSKADTYTPSKISTDLNYLMEDFVADFNIAVLTNPTNEFYNKFYVNEKGINLKYADPISIAQIEAGIKDNVKYGQELADYSVISKNMPNFKEAEEVQDRRLDAINNKVNLKKPTSQVTAVDKTTILVKNEAEEFLNYQDKVFQLRNKEGSNSVYMQLQEEQSLDYFQVEVGTAEYLQQVKVKQQKLESYSKVDKKYKEADLGGRFDCA